MEFVYVANSTIHNVYKIGYTRSPRKRIMDLRSIKPASELIMIFAGTRADEKSLHNMFKNVRVHGEWFRLSKNQLKKIEMYFSGNEAMQLKMMKDLSLSLCNNPVAWPRKRGEPERRMDKSRYNKEGLPLSEQEKVFIDPLRLRKGTAEVIKKTWLDDISLTRKELAQKSGFSLRTVQYVVAALKKSDPLLYETQ